MADMHFYAFLLIAISLALASLLFMNAYLFAFSALVLAAAISMYKLWYIIEAIAFRHSNIIKVIDAYELSSDRKVAIRHTENGFVAVSAARLDTSQINEMSKEKLESIIGRIGLPFKLVMNVKQVNAKSLMAQLVTSRYEKELALSKAKSTGNKAAERAIERQLELIQKDIDTISESRPLQLLYYVFAFSVSDSPAVAREEALENIKSIAGAFDGAMNSKSSIVEAEELEEIMLADMLIK